MATNWYDPTGSNSGFYNSPQDFLFKSQGGTWYGQGASGQDDASRMPTMGEYYFGGPEQAPQAQPQMGPINLGGPQRPEGYNAPQFPRMGGGGGGVLNLGNEVSVPTGPLWNRYQSVQANPRMIEADPAFQYLKSTGEEALRRRAAAGRKRFSGETMLDFQKHAQGAAATYLQNLLPELRAGAGQEFNIDRQNVLGRRSEATAKSFQSDPYGHARNLAGRYRSLQEYMASPEYARSASMGRGQEALELYRRGEELNRSMFGG